MTRSEPEPETERPVVHRSFARRHWMALTVVAVSGVPALVFTIWAGGALAFNYASGERSGFVQKLSKKGWLCKTWEGELAMANLPGTIPQLFTFTVRSDSIAGEINKAMAKGGGRVVLYYEQHVGVPSSCFGETEYFVKGVRGVNPG